MKGNKIIMLTGEERQLIWDVFYALSDEIVSFRAGQPSFLKYWKPELVKAIDEFSLVGGGLGKIEDEE